MGSPGDDRGVSALHELLQEGSKGPGPKSEALEALSLRPVWLATWEPRAEGFRTLINAKGEEALAVFSSEQGLRAAAKQLEWTEEDGSLATHRAIGGDILRHAWTREYAFIVIDIGSDHMLEYERRELKAILRDLDATGPFRTSRPPAPPTSSEASSSFPPPKERKPVVVPSTVYSMAPSQAERLDRLSDLPTKPHDAPYDSEPPTQPRASLADRSPPGRPRKSSRPARKPKSEPPGSKVEEIGARPSELGDGGTYGAASIIPASDLPPKHVYPRATEAKTKVESVSTPDASSTRTLNSDAPTAPSAQPATSLEPGKLKLPAIGPIGGGGLEPPPPTDAKPEDDAKAKPVPTKQPRVVGPSIGDGIKLVDLHDPPDEDLLATLAEVLRGYFEIEWASYCHVGRPAGGASPAIGLRIDDNYRDNVTSIIKALCEAARKHAVDIDVLLIDGHDMLRKAREKALVFYPWMPKA